MWDDYHVFLIATLVFTKLLLDEIYHLIELPFEWLIDDAVFVCLVDELILGFCYCDLTLETGGFQLASTYSITSEPTNQHSSTYGKKNGCVEKVVLERNVYCP